jgi:hypothetical protein
MTRQYVYIIAISLLVLIVSISGCVSNQAAVPAATADATMKMPAATMAAVVATVSPGSGVQSDSLFDRSKFTWYQYKVDSSDMMGMPMVHTYNYSTDMLNGQMADHFNFTMDMRPSTLLYIDIWSNPADNSTLKIHEIVYKNGNLTKNADIDAGNYSKFVGEDLASPNFLKDTLSPAGSETVTIGDKTYTATKYTNDATDEQFTFWVSKDVPVPVKILDHMNDSDTTYELTSWG